MSSTQRTQRSETIVFESFVCFAVKDFCNLLSQNFFHPLNHLTWLVNHFFGEPCELLAACGRDFYFLFLGIGEQGGVSHTLHKSIAQELDSIWRQSGRRNERPTKLT